MFFMKFILLLTFAYVLVEGLMEGTLSLFLVNKNVLIWLFLEYDSSANWAVGYGLPFKVTDDLDIYGTSSFMERLFDFVNNIVSYRKLMFPFLYPEKGTEREWNHQNMHTIRNNIRHNYSGREADCSHHVLLFINEQQIVIALLLAASRQDHKLSSFSFSRWL